MSVEVRVILLPVVIKHQILLVNETTCRATLESGGTHAPPNWKSKTEWVIPLKLESLKWPPPLEQWQRNHQISPKPHASFYSFFFYFLVFFYPFFFFFRKSFDRILVRLSSDSSFQKRTAVWNLSDWMESLQRGIEILGRSRLTHSILQWRRNCRRGDKKLEFF